MAYKKIASTGNSCSGEGRIPALIRTKIKDDYNDISSNHDLKEVDHVSESNDEQPIDDFEILQTKLNNMDEQAFDNELDTEEDKKDGENRQVTLEEIKEAVWDCGSSKAPGLNGLHNAFEEAVGNGLITGVNIKNSTINVSHLFYADDVIITTDWNAKDMDNIIRVLQFLSSHGLRLIITSPNIILMPPVVSDVVVAAAVEDCSGYFSANVHGQFVTPDYNMVCTEMCYQP
ncbi:hypothetical protein Tco_1523604 [Tanacetum coccineum]